MTDDDAHEHRTRFRAAPGEVDYRQPADEDDMMEIRIPIASSGEVRNEGDDPLTPGELRGMAEQVNDLGRGVFPEHGESDIIDFAGYSQFEKLGFWAAAELEPGAADDDEDLLMATARMPDPETLPAATKSYRTALAILKEQAKRGIPIDASIGWRDDDDFAGGVDLMEASIVGIGADPRTNTADADPVATVTRAAVEAGADPEDLIASIREALPDDARPFGPPNNPDQWDSFEECVAEVENWDGVDDAEAFCGWAQDQTEDQSANDDMTDDTESETTDEQDADDPDAEQSGEDEQTEARQFDDAAIERVMDAVEESFREHMDAAMNDIEAALRQENEQASDEDEEDEEMDDEEEEEDDDDMQSADAPETDDAQGVDDDLQDEVHELRSELSEVRDRLATGESPDDVADTPETDADQSADEATETEQRDEQSDDPDDSTLRDEWLSTDD